MAVMLVYLVEPTSQRVFGIEEDVTEQLICDDHAAGLLMTPLIADDTAATWASLSRSLR